MNFTNIEISASNYFYPINNEECLLAVLNNSEVPGIDLGIPFFQSFYWQFDFENGEIGYVLRQSENNEENNENNEENGENEPTATQDSGFLGHFLLDALIFIAIVGACVLLKVMLDKKREKKAAINLDSGEGYISFEKINDF